VMLKSILGPMDERIYSSFTSKGSG